MTMINVSISLLLLVTCSISYHVSPSTYARTTHLSMISITKSAMKPVLNVYDKQNNVRVHLIGVSHGSPASSDLVKQIVETVKPSVIVLELCEDRYISMSIDAKIKPTGNDTLLSIYNDKVETYNKKMNERQLANNTTIFSDSKSVLNQLYSAVMFAKQQGLIGGLFVILGLAVSAIQRLSRPNLPTVLPAASLSGNDNDIIGASSSDITAQEQFQYDEFLTAMYYANINDVPVILGDASQNATLASIKSIISPDVLNPAYVIDGFKQLMFSAFGYLPIESNAHLSRRIGVVALSDSEWISIPRAYLEDTSMLKSLSPIIAAIGITTIVSTIFAYNTNNINDVGTVTAAAASTSVSIQGILYALLFGEGPGEYYVSTITDIFSLLLLIRMTKIIGTDRDLILAKSVKDTMARYPGCDIVVVLGMLHINGVAKWLLASDVDDPALFNSSISNSNDQ